jgi:hypothetical protein
MQLVLGLDIGGIAAAHGDALLDLDFAHGRYGFAGKVHAGKAAFLGASGGVAMGSAMVLGPHIVGAEMIPDGAFSSGGLDGWASTPAHAANGSLSVLSNRIVAAINSPIGAYRAARANPVTAGRAYLFGGDIAAKGTSPPLNSASINCSTNPDLGGSDLRFGDLGGATPLPQRLEVVGGTSATTLFSGFVTAVDANTPASISFDNFSLREVQPYAGYLAGGFAFRLAATTPSAASGNKVALQWGTDGERYRVRLVWDASRHLRLIVTVGGSDQANLDLGEVAISTPFSLEASIGPDRILARLDDGATVFDLTSAVPSVGRFWIGRSYSGEAWDGDLHRLQVWPRERLPANAILVEGDSYTAGTGVASLGGALPSALPGRAVVSTGVGGGTPAGTAARLAATPGLARGVVIIWDGDMNTGSVVETQLAAYAEIVARIRHTRYLILPSCRRAAKSAGDNANVATLQAALAAAYPGNVLDAQAVLAAHATAPGDNADTAGGYIPASLLSGDLVHLTATAMGYVAAAVAAEIGARGW